MLAIITVFKENEIHIKGKPYADLPVCMQPLFKNRTLIEYYTSVLKNNGYDRLLLITDYARDTFDAIQKLNIGLDVELEERPYKEKLWCSSDFLNRFKEEEGDILWLQGDLLLQKDILERLCRQEKSTYVGSYNTVSAPENPEPCSFRGFCQHVAFYEVSEDAPLCICQAIKLCRSDLAEFCASHAQDDSCENEENEPFDFLFWPLPEAEDMILLCGQIAEWSIVTKRAEFFSLLDQALYSNPQGIFQFQQHICALEPKTVLLIVDEAALRENCGRMLSASFASNMLVLHEADNAELFTEGQKRLSGEEINTLIACGGHECLVFARKLCQNHQAKNEKEKSIVLWQVFSGCTPEGITGLYVEEKTAGKLVAYSQSIPEVLTVWPGESTLAEQVCMCAHILAVGMEALFTGKGADIRLQKYSQQLFTKLDELKNFSGQNLYPEVLLANRVESMYVPSPLNNVARILQKQTGWSLPLSRIYILAAVVLYIKDKLPQRSFRTSRKILADILDEIFIQAHVEDEKHLCALVKLIFTLEGSNGQYQMKEADYHEIYKGIAEVNGEALPFAISKEMLTESLAMMQKQMETAMALPESLPEKINYKTLCKHAVQVYRQEAFSELYRMQSEELLDIARACKASGIELVMLQDKPLQEVPEDEINQREESNPKDLRSLWSLDRGFMLAIKAQDLSRFEAMCEQTLSSKYVIERNSNAVAGCFVDIMLYRCNTLCCNRWNINALDRHMEIGIPIKLIFSSVHIAGESSLMRKADMYNRQVCRKVGYFLLPRNLKEKVLHQLYRYVSTQRLEEKRDKTLQKLYKVTAEGEVSHVCEIFDRRWYTLKSHSNISLNEDDIQLPIFCYKPDRMTAEETDKLMEKVYRLRDTKQNEYFIADPKLKVQAAKSVFIIVRNLIKTKYKQLRAAIRKRIGTIKAKIGTFIKEVKPKIRSWVRKQWVLVTGSIRGMGLCISAKSRKLKSYRNKYAGQRCFLIGNGPSLRAEDLDKLKNEITFGCNFIHKIYAQTDWRPTYHFISDSTTVRVGCWDIVRHLDEKKTTMFIREFAYGYMSVKPKEAVLVPYISTDDYKVSGNFLAYHYISHASVLSMMMEAAMYMGFKDIYILGADGSMSSAKGGNFAQNYLSPAMKEQMKQRREKIGITDVVQRRRELAQKQESVFIKVRDYADAHGFHIYNATRGGVLEMFTRVNFDEVVER